MTGRGDRRASVQAILLKYLGRMNSCDLALILHVLIPETQVNTEFINPY